MKYQKIAQRFSDILARNNMTAKELAEKSDVSESSISQYVNGNHKPSNITAGKIAKVFDINPLWLMGYDVIRTKTTGTVFLDDGDEDFQAVIMDALRFADAIYNSGFILRPSEDFNDLFVFSAGGENRLLGISVQLDINEVKSLNANIQQAIKETAEKFIENKVHTLLNAKSANEEGEKENGTI